MDGDRGYWDEPTPDIRLGLCSSVLLGHSIERALAIAGETGYDGVAILCAGKHLHPGVENETVERVAQALSTFGMECVSLVTDVADFACVGDREAEEALEILERYLSIAERLRCPLVRVKAGGPAVPEHLREDHWLRAAHYLREACDMALGRRIDLSLHNDVGLTATVDTTLNLVHTVDRPNLFVTYDPAHLALTDRYYGIEALERMAHVLLDVQVRDVKLFGEAGEPTLMGEGHLDYAGIFAWLKTSAYQGFVSVDCRRRPGPEMSAVEIARHEHAALRQLLEET
jgi:sugar phosphate isomerase/epimerase